jgi:hypothetical protein
MTEIRGKIWFFRNDSGFRGRSDYHVDCVIKFKDLADEWLSASESCKLRWLFDGYFRRMQPFLRDRSAGDVGYKKNKMSTDRESGRSA